MKLDTELCTKCRYFSFGKKIPISIFDGRIGVANLTTMCPFLFYGEIDLSNPTHIQSLAYNEQEIKPGMNDDDIIKIARPKYNHECIRTNYERVLANPDRIVWEEK